MYRIIGFLLAMLFSVCSLQAQQKVTFYAADSLKVTADLYLNAYEVPFIILLHQAEASRGEYQTIAPRLVKLGYNCLAVDLRSGNKINFVTNETAIRAKEAHLPNSFIDAERDIFAAIEFVKKYNKQGIIIMGSSYSASLGLMLTAKSPAVEAVIACSPGEYFRPSVTVKEQLEQLNVPVFITATQSEVKFVQQLLSEVPDSLIHIYYPQKDEGAHGAKIFWESSVSSNECWLELLMFFKRIKFE